MHQHISKVLEWGFDENHDFKATLWGCSLCDETADKPFEYEEISIDHTACDEDCFGCKAKGLQLNPGDAGRPIGTRTWEGNLAEYRKAREQGIQPASTNVHAVRAAVEASQTLGKAYNAENMVRADKVTKSVAEVMKAVE